MPKNSFDSLRAGNFRPISQSELHVGTEVTLLIYPRYSIRQRRPWRIRGRVVSVNPAGCLLVGDMSYQGRSYRAKFAIPIVYFREQRVHA
jgi:hypothetical protein